MCSNSADKSRLRAVGRGPDQPIMPNTTAEGRKANGRMELHVEQASGSTPPTPP